MNNNHKSESCSILCLGLQSGEAEPLVRLLKDVGHRVTAAPAEDAELLAHQRPDIVILDAQAPGCENIARQVAEARQGAVLLLLDPERPAPMELVRVSGAVGCLAPPYQENVVGAVVHAAAQQHREVRRLREELELLQEKLELRKLIERAKSVLMEVHEMTEAEAFRRIQTQSMNSRRSMGDVARLIIATRGS